jgi:hypothetical protein
VGGTCGTHGRETRKSFVGKPEGKRPLERPRRRWMVSELILGDWLGDVVESVGSGSVPVAVCCEHGEHSVSGATEFTLLLVSYFYLWLYRGK